MNFCSTVSLWLDYCCIILCIINFTSCKCTVIPIQIWTQGCWKFFYVLRDNNLMPKFSTETQFTNFVSIIIKFCSIGVCCHSKCKTQQCVVAIGHKWHRCKLGLPSSATIAALDLAPDISCLTHLSCSSTNCGVIAPTQHLCGHACAT